MNKKGIPLDQVKYDFINIFEKKKSSVINRNKMSLFKNDNDNINANLSHKVTKSNTNNDSHNNNKASSINPDEK